MNWDTIKHFSKQEFACKCGTCGSDGSEMNLDFVAKLNFFRESLGVPFKVTSGYRCPFYNNQVSSTGENGPHTTGHAADIHLVGADVLRLMRLLPGSGITGVGLNQKGPYAGRFIHLDDIESGPRPWVWTY